MKECPSCGTIVDEEMTFCPACGSKLTNITQSKKRINAVLENDLALAEAYASSIFTQKNIIKKQINAGELNFLNIIDRYPTEPKVYIAYVNYTTKYIERAMNWRVGDEIITFSDINGIIEKCKIFLNNASKYNTDNDDEVIQELSRLQARLESIKMNRSEIDAKNQKRNMIWVFSVVFFVISMIIVLILSKL